MIAVYERSLCQSYRSAYLQGIRVSECATEEETMRELEALTCDSYHCFAVGPDGTVYDLTGTWPQLLAEEVAECSARR